MTEPKIMTTTFRVGKKYKCTWTFDLDGYRPGGVTHSKVEWEPDLPDRGLTKNEIRDYRRGRDAFFAEIAHATGLRTMVVET